MARIGAEPSNLTKKMIEKVDSERGKLSPKKREIQKPKEEKELDW